MKKIAFLFTVALVFSVASLSAQSAKNRLDNGKQLFDQGNYDEAIKELSEAIKLDPKMAEAYAYRALSYNGKKDYENGLNDANEAVKRNKKLAIGFFARGNAYFEMVFKYGGFDRAIADYTQAIKLDPNYANAYINRGYVYYYYDRDFERAIADFTEAIKVDPKNADAYYNRGNVYLSKADYNRAITDYTEVIKLEPKYVSAYNNRGLAYEGKDDNDSAVADYTEVLRIDPNNNLAKEKLAKEQQKIAETQRKLAQEEANKYDRSKFIIVPSVFQPADYKKADLFAAVAASEKLNVRDYAFGLSFTPSLDFVSDVVFVSQNGTDITFRTADNAISKRMKVDSRTGLTQGQKVRIYYTAYRADNWTIAAIERM